MYQKNIHKFSYSLYIHLRQESIDISEKKACNNPNPQRFTCLLNGQMELRDVPMMSLIGELDLENFEEYRITY